MSVRSVVYAKLFGLVYAVIQLPNFFMNGPLYRTIQSKQFTSPTITTQGLTEGILKWRSLSVGYVSDSTSLKHEHRSVDALLRSGFQVRKFFVFDLPQQTPCTDKKTGISIQPLTCGGQCCLADTDIKDIDLIFYDVCQNFSSTCLLGVLDSAARESKKVVVLDRMHRYGKYSEVSLPYAGEFEKAVRLKPEMTIGDIAWRLNQRALASPADLTVVPVLTNGIPS